MGQTVHYYFNTEDFSNLVLPQKSFRGNHVGDVDSVLDDASMHDTVWFVGATSPGDFREAVIDGMEERGYYVAERKKIQGVFVYELKSS